MDRAFVALNMASSIDGKTSTFERVKLRLGGFQDRKRMEELRASADGVLIGSKTLVTDDPPLIIRDPEIVVERLKRKGNKQPINMVVSSAMEFPISTADFFQNPQTERVVFTTSLADQSRVQEARRYAQVVRLGQGSDGRVDLSEMLSLMPSLGVRNILLEGGGTLNYAMLRLGLVDEIYLTICPYVIAGADSPSIFDGAGFPKESLKCLDLVDCKAGNEGEVFLRYSISRDQKVVRASREFRHGFEVTRAY